MKNIGGRNRMDKIYLVMGGGGEWDSAYSYPIMAFISIEDAKKYIDEITNEVELFDEISSKVHDFKASWEKQNKKPKYATAYAKDKEKCAVEWDLWVKTRETATKAFLNSIGIGGLFSRLLSFQENRTTSGYTLEYQLIKGVPSNTPEYFNIEEIEVG